MERRKGFTLVELLVVIAIIALLMGILMPALARVRQIAYRLYCGTNLSGIGKAMLIYSNDYDDELPRAGLAGGSWSNVSLNWTADTAAAAYPGGNGTISSCFYLLVKYAEVTPKSFLCKGDSGVTEFKISTYTVPAGKDIVDLWDFGPKGQDHCSYSYHAPFGKYALTSTSDPGMAVAGDPNPWLASCETPARPASDWTEFLRTGDRESIKWGNALPHQEDGQNVLFVDGHTSFEKASFCGVDDDNVFTIWSGADKRKGARPAGPGTSPADRSDSLLLTDNDAVVAR